MRVEYDLFCCLFDIDVNLNRPSVAEATAKLKVVERNVVIDRLHAGTQEPCQHGYTEDVDDYHEDTYMEGSTSLSRAAIALG